MRAGDGDEDVTVNVGESYDEFWFEGEESERVIQRIDPNEGIDVIIMTADGDDLILGDANTYRSMIVHAGNGRDRIVGGRGGDELHGGDGIEAISGDGFSLDLEALKTFTSNLLNAKFIASAALFPDYGSRNKIYGEGGFDVLIGGDEDDCI